MSAIYIEQLSYLKDEEIQELSDILVRIVDSGASIGFLAPMDQEEAVRYWKGVVSSDVILLTARENGKILGTGQLHLVTKANGNHRAEIAKVMTHPDFQQRGIGRLLMNTLEEKGREENRSLLVLDTREGDPSNRLYTSLGYVQAGKIPGFAKSSDGNLDATVIYYKNI